MKNKIGWYHTTEFDSPGEIFFCPDEDGPVVDDQENYFGPFKTFAIARKDAIEYHQTDLDTARRCIKALKEMRKPRMK